VFTGIIRHVGRVRRVAATAAGRRVEIDLGPLAAALRAGGSLAVNGACLTAAEVAAPLAAFDVVAETLARTTLGRLAAGDRVNLEPALRLQDPLDGHLVQGHVDGTAEVRRVDREGEWRVAFTTGRELTDQMVPKGSIAIDGVSLTLADLADGTFSVALVPTTLAETTLADLAPGRPVNVETDLLGKYVRRWLDTRAETAAGDTPPAGLTLQGLQEHGFA